jgi:hypothetical protein
MLERLSGNANPPAPAPFERMERSLASATPRATRDPAATAVHAHRAHPRDEGSTPGRSPPRRCRRPRRAPGKSCNESTGARHRPRRRRLLVHDLLARRDRPERGPLVALIAPAVRVEDVDRAVEVGGHFGVELAARQVPCSVVGVDHPAGGVDDGDRHRSVADHLLEPSPAISSEPSGTSADRRPGDKAERPHAFGPSDEFRGTPRSQPADEERRRRVRNRSLHVHVPRRIHRRPQ